MQQKVGNFEQITNMWSTML
jgi:CheY-like chemotaxis protein